MEEKIEFSLVLPLKEICRRRISASLFTHDDIVTLIKTCKFNSYSYSDKFREGNILYDQIIGRVKKLFLPITVEDELKETIHSIGFEILKFKCFQEKYLGENNHFFDNEIQIYWTYLGTIDKFRTAMSFVKDDKIDVTLRYKIACIYCLEDDIPTLWEKMSEDDKKFSFKTDSLPIYRVLISFWESKMKKRPFRLRELRRMNENVYVDALEYAAYSGNIAATRYFFQKLSDKEKKEEVLKMTKYILRKVEFSKEYYFEVLQFLLLQMSEKDQLDVFQAGSYNLLCCFMEWPLQPYFNNLAGHLWSYLVPSEFNDLLWHITIRNLEHKSNGCDYKSLFSRLWSESPLHFKKYIISQEPWEHLLCHLYETGDIGSANLMLKMVTPEQVDGFITGNSGLHLSYSLTWSNKFYYLVACLEACVTSETIGEILKGNFKKFLARTIDEKICVAGEESWKHFFTLLDAKISALAARRETGDRNN
ncbi:uncharacterized protein TNIN_321561 [Trichonephila inaurata madagascariensis]|uniref:Uncharacterized protein n=1 Tax=Trichonephila inaurata madagascariensis TaxID=2747483 RepID=A0A8X6XRI2_9ARAC|nr:uncharacterized protein TNIN_321561 [Trichonephila inaurata madagascariensis]